MISLAVAEEVIAVVESKTTSQKMVLGVTNEVWDGSEVQVGKRISRAEGELDINSSMRGLNSLIIDKNKLIVFD